MDDKISRLMERLSPEQRDRFLAVLDAGWRIETDWHKIAARYRDLDLAENVPREIIYLDLGFLAGRIELLESFLDKLGYREREGECTCRTHGCGHVASAHSGPGGACVVPECRCGPGGWS